MPLFHEIRSRARRVAPQVLAACMVGYFAYHAMQGDRGFNAWVTLKQRIKQAEIDNQTIAAERALLEHRVALLRPDNLDPDLLEEQARALLSFGHEDDYIVILPKP